MSKVPYLVPRRDPTMLNLIDWRVQYCCTHAQGENVIGHRARWYLNNINMFNSTMLNSSSFRLTTYNKTEFSSGKS